ncbi:YihY/virulence factor BrkB family protein [Pseudomonas chlororaphis]|jgi:membrane protein|uniref:YihY/virulence factor BrkB family protein n=1 Tax=Pseudomonas chlororaphis subsp. aurantiaca TaxID=86192 RepID=A0AAJ0ZJ60_9PSED|nr:YihY/virulence factor BrkB family protein [Pseudomonas chlororaphis]AIS11617.1 ribonuclease BN [Pseudomonas chlororaphis subsp. aurantiaca]AZD50189.1 Inner membrane protein YihY, formerly thought to be RNase BN [Pseudomonas chlororaphis subsp. aurantiaca]AZD75056.1 Inner membrane protein YihY, formerly thought to be RNase BN [Pseudomonas chlororaphis subsp. aurantiaca]AZD81305.1 Inner membrane protein YihY, formerly thought to be RNase BN [Pseudomonas chlororaphis subsp. aurantiaca]AZD87930
MFLPNLKGLPLHRVLVRTVTEFIDDEMSTYASALAYQMLFSLFPFILFLIALIGFLHLPDFFSWLRLQSELVLPPQALEQVNPVIDQLQQSKGGLLSVGIVIALYTASAGVRLMMSAMNAAYDVVEKRPLWKRFPLSIFYTIGIAGMLLVAAALMVLGPQVMGWIAAQVGLEDFIVTVWTILRWPVIVILMMVAVALIYYVMPDVKQEFRFITPGSVLAVVVWIIASLGFAFYVKTFANYNAMYGSIGAIIVLLLYFYISSAVLLLGAEMNAAIEHMSSDGKNPGERVPGEHDEPKQHVSGLGRDHSLKPTTDEV